MKESYKLGRAELMKELQARETGLSTEEALKRTHIYGENRLKEGKRPGPLSLFFAQFKDLMTLILIGAAVLSGVLAFLTREPSGLADTGILLFVILLNAVVGFIQQYRADSAIEKLKKLSVSTAKTIRDGKAVLLDAALLVPGDVIELAEGDRIPADCRILSAQGFRCDESALTGESRPVQKRDCIVRRTALAARENTAHMGTFCVGGEARCIVTATGMDTEMGQIAGLLQSSAPTPSPLDKTILKLGKLITGTVLAVAAVLFLGGLLARRVSVLDNLMTAVAVAVAAIPEGMGAVVTIILAMGVQRMSKAHTVMRKLASVETLGSCTCICSDKTGTLTMNRMTVDGIFTGSEGEHYTGTAAERRLMTCVRMCHTVRGDPGSYLGDPTEIALLEYADRVGFFTEGKHLGGIPFSSERKRMSVAAEIGGVRKLYVKGGAEVLLARCSRIASSEDDRLLTKRDMSEIFAHVAKFSGQAKRVLAFAEGEYSGETKEENLTFLGLIAMSDPPKAGAKEAVEACRRAGIRTVMITGDSADTAFAIAKRLGIAETRGEVVTGEELDEVGDALSRRAGEISVYARVSPGHKQQIVKALQARGEVVAMTGDGVNDAPSVRAADIGVAMGSGTDVTKNAADMVIEDDDFSTMVGAVEEGRNVFCNIKRTISFFLSTNFAEVLAVLVATLFLWKYEFLTSTQLLWINLITDSLPVLALGVERTEGVMERPPVTLDEIFGKRPLISMLAFGVLQALIVLGLFLFGVLHWGNAAATTCAFLTLSLLELFHAFNVRKEHGRTTFKEFFSDRMLIFTVLLGLLLNVLLVVVPFFARAFGLVPLTAVQWFAVLGCSLAILPLGEIYKAFSPRRAFPSLKKRPASPLP